MPRETIFRPTSNWIYLGIIISIEILVIATFIYAGKNETAVISIFNSIAVDILFWVFVAQPKIVFTDSGIKIYNPFRITKIGWLVVDDFETRYSFTVLTGNKKIRSWAATAPGRYGSRSIHSSDFKGTGLADRIVLSPSDSPRTDSGVALILAAKRREDSIKAGTGTAELGSRVPWLNLVLASLAITILWINITHF